jgi:glucosamine--fructose-6-phosphate aminotransferase (isomerizing)
MCGIVAYLGKQPAYQILMNGLERLEYRGYDSAGIALMNGQLNLHKVKGKVSDLRAATANQCVHGNLGIGHTRWATHGEPDVKNAHPHLSQNGRLVLVHNGIIENYQSLKDQLIQMGYTFYGDTDSEVLVNWIEWTQQQGQTSLDVAIRTALKAVHGAYAIAVFDKENPEQLFAARNGSPLVLGLGEDGFYFASDTHSIAEHTQKIIYLEDEQIATVTLDQPLTIHDFFGQASDWKIDIVDASEIASGKGDFPHYMLKEIHEQPTRLHTCLEKSLHDPQALSLVQNIEQHWPRLEQASRIIIVACGTSWHAGLVAEYLIEQIAALSVEVEVASEFRYRRPLINPTDVVIGISQSGETADTIAALELAKSKGAFTCGMVNTPASTISRMTDMEIQIHAGQEIGVASTKAFTNQIMMLSLLGIALAAKKGMINPSRMQQFVGELERIPRLIPAILSQKSVLNAIAQTMKDAPHVLFLGRGVNFPIALEGALKLKEISYIPSIGYPAGEMKHGPIALIDEHTPVVFVATNKSALEKLASNMQEVKARKGKVIAIVQEGDTHTSHLADHTIAVPQTADWCSPLLSVIPLQLLAYFVALEKGCDVDRPRNLAKSVTVE